MNTIKQTRGFSKERFFQLTKRMLVVNRQRWAIGFAGALGVLFVIWLVGTYFSPQFSQINITVISLGLIFYKFGGYFLTSGVFSELNSIGSASQILTLPATNFEKLFTAWFLSYFTYTIIVVGFLFMLSLLLGVQPSLFALSFGDPIVDMSRIYMLDTVLTFTAYHSAFLLGAVYFKNNNFLKTVLAVVLFLAFIGILSVILINITPNKISFSYQFIHSPGRMYILAAFGKIAVAILFLFLSYRQLQNRQVA